MMKNKLFTNIIFTILLSSVAFSSMNKISSIESKINIATQLIEQNKQKTALALLLSEEKYIEIEKNIKIVTNYYMLLGDLNLLLGKYKQSFIYFDIAIQKAIISNDKELLSASHNNLGNIYLFSGHPKKANDYYKKALKYTNDTNLILSINLNRLKVSSYADKDEEFFKNFNQYYNALNRNLSSKENSISIKIAINFYIFSAKLLERRYFEKNIEAKLLEKSFQINDKILKLLNIISNTNLASMIYGATGKLELLQNNYKKALDSFHKASFFAQTQNIKPDLLYYWKFRIAQIYKNDGNIDKAIDIYTDSLSLLEPIKQQLYYGFRDINDRFNNDIVPIYQDLIELHFEKLQTLDDDKKIDQRLKTIITLYNKLKISELEFFYLNECISTFSGTQIEIPSDTVIIYPIALQNQLLIITQTNKNYSYHTHYLPFKELEQLVKDFRYQLQVKTNAKFINFAHALYDMIIAPFEYDLKENNITQLVFSPQGFMGLIPYSTLMKNNKFLIEDFSIAQINTLETTQFKKQDNNPFALVLGLSDARHGMSALPNVVNEVKNVSSMFDKTTILLNTDYTANKVKDVLKKERITHLHIATHGVFDFDPQESFLSAYDKPIKLENLKALLDTNYNKSDGYDLITLSACQSSIGNEKALLGLAGVGLQSGASTVLATLWYVDDEATKEIINTFYVSLKNKRSRAQSLQDAQNNLIKTKRYWHPAFWSPFIIIGDWR